MGNVKRLVGSFVFGLFFAVNPAFFTGCGAVTGAKFAFGEAQVVAVADIAAKAQRYEVAGDDGAYEVLLDLSQVQGEDSRSSALSAAPIRVAHACGNRTFLRSAHACLEETKMPLAGTVTVRRLSPEVATLVDKAEAKGSMSIYGTTLSNAHVEVTAGAHTLLLQSNDAKTFKVVQLVVGGKEVKLASTGG